MGPRRSAISSFQRKELRFEDDRCGNASLARSGAVSRLNDSAQRAGSATRVDDPVRVTVAGVEVEGGHVWSHDESNPNSPSSAWMVVKNRWSDPLVFPSTSYEMVLMQGSADQAAGTRLP